MIAFIMTITMKKIENRTKILTTSTRYRESLKKLIEKSLHVFVQVMLYFGKERKENVTVKWNIVKLPSKLSEEVLKHPN